MQELYFDEDVERFREMASSLAAGEIQPLANMCDAENRFPEELKETLFNVGILTMAIPEEYGGIGASTQALSVVLEEVAYAFGTMGPVLLSTFSPAKIVAAVGQPDQKKAFFDQLCAKPCVTAFCLSEPHCGSDARAIKTRECREGGGLPVRSGGSQTAAWPISIW